MTHAKLRSSYRPRLALLALAIPLGALGCTIHASGGAKSSSSASSSSKASASASSSSSASASGKSSAKSGSTSGAKSGAHLHASASGNASMKGNSQASGGGKSSASGSSKSSASAQGSSSSSINLKSGTKAEGVGKAKKTYEFKSTVLVGGGNLSVKESSSIKVGGSASGSGSSSIKVGGSASGSASGKGRGTAGGSAKGSTQNEGTPKKGDTPDKNAEKDKTADKSKDKDEKTPTKKTPDTKKEPVAKPEKDPPKKGTKDPAKKPESKPEAPVVTTPPQPIDPPEVPPENVFGYEDPIKGCFEGVVYPLAPKTSKLPTAWSSLEAISVVYACEWDIPTRKWETGFPGVADRFEWFAIQYTGAFHVQKAGKWKFRISSDDGSKLYIDGKLVVDNDGEHPPQSRDGSIELTAGDHKMVLEYFQGPRYHINLQVYATPPGGKEGLFSVR